MNGSPAKMGTISGTAGHSSALKMRASENAASAFKQLSAEEIAKKAKAAAAENKADADYYGSAEDKAKNKTEKKPTTLKGSTVSGDAKDGSDKSKQSKASDQKPQMSDKKWAAGNKKSGGTLNELVSARKGHKKGSAEYAAIQNKINSSLGSKKVHKGTKVNKKGETVETKPKGTTTRKTDGATVKKGLGAQKGKTLSYTDKAAEKVKIEKANVKIKEGKSTKDKNKRDEGQLEKGEIKSGRDNKKTGTMLSRALAKRKVKRNARQLAKRAKKNEEAPAKKYDK